MNECRSGERQAFRPCLKLYVLITSVRYVKWRTLSSVDAVTHINCPWQFHLLSWFPAPPVLLVPTHPQHSLFLFLSLSLSLSLCPFCCHPTTYSTRPHCSTVCTGPVFWKRFVMHFETYCIGKQDASISQLLTLKDTSMSSFHLLCRRIW